MTSGPLNSHAQDKCTRQRHAHWFPRLRPGETPHFSTFNGNDFAEGASDAQLNDDRLSTVACRYWILKLQARFISGEHDVAIAAGQRAKELLSSSVDHILLLDYYFYLALTVAAIWDDDALPSNRAAWRELLTVHLERLREWTENGSAKFQDKYALAAAEVARIERRDLDAMHLYDAAIRSARENGFVQSEGIANELAGSFYLDRGFETNGYAHLREARACFVRLGIKGKVRQLDGRYPRLTAGSATSGAAIERLDVVSVVKASQVMSGEIDLQTLIEKLMTIALQTAGADRALLILPHLKDYRIAAEAHAGGNAIVRQQSSGCGLAAPESVLRYVTRTRESVILDDAMQDNLFSEDDYLVSRRPRSVLCLPLLRQGALSGLLYLEHRMTSHVFASERTTLLDLVASQAAISLENARLYRDLQEREAQVRRLVDANIIGIFIWDLDGEIIDANDAFLRIVAYGRDDFVTQTVRWTELTPAEWRDRDAMAVKEINATGAAQPYEKEFLRKDGKRVPVLVGAAAFGGRPDQGVSFVIDLTERKRAEAEAREIEQQYRAVQMELAHTNRVATMGQLTASIAHEVQQPIAATAINGLAALRWLRAQPANLEEAGLALDRIVSDTKRAGAIIGRIRDLVEKAPAREDDVDINEAIREMIELTHGEAQKSGVSVRTQLADGLPLIRGDRVQLQQVTLNLIINAIEAMSGIAEGPRELLVTTGLAEPRGVFVAVQDSGPGLAPTTLERLFDPFYTTKPGGLGIGLSICRSIIKGHGGRLWAVINEPRGAIFQFTLPVRSDRAS